MPDPREQLLRDLGYTEKAICAGLQAAGSAVTDMVRGMRIDSVHAVGVAEIIAYLGGTFPEVKLDCVELARDTLHKAAAEYAAAHA